jgi:hypothetical protein
VTQEEPKPESFFALAAEFVLKFQFDQNDSGARVRFRKMADYQFSGKKFQGELEYVKVQFTDPAQDGLGMMSGNFIVTVPVRDHLGDRRVQTKVDFYKYTNGTYSVASALRIKNYIDKLLAP